MSRTYKTRPGWLVEWADGTLEHDHRHGPCRPESLADARDAARGANRHHWQVCPRYRPVGDGEQARRGTTLSCPAGYATVSQPGRPVGPGSSGASPTLNGSTAPVCRAGSSTTSTTPRCAAPPGTRSTGPPANGTPATGPATTMWRIAGNRPSCTPAAPPGCGGDGGLVRVSSDGADRDARPSAVATMIRSAGRCSEPSGRRRRGCDLAGHRDDLERAVLAGEFPEDGLAVVLSEWVGLLVDGEDEFDHRLGGDVDRLFGGDGVLEGDDGNNRRYELPGRRIVRAPQPVRVRHVPGGRA